MLDLMWRILVGSPKKMYRLPISDKLFKEEMARYKESVLTDDQFVAKYGDLGPIYG